LFTGLGLVGFWLAGKKVWWAWYINIFNQFLWTAFALITGYYALLIGTAFYFFVFTKNAYSWTNEHYAKKTVGSYPVAVKLDFNSAQFQAEASKAREAVADIPFPNVQKMQKKKGQPLELDGNPVFISSSPAQLHHICHATPIPMNEHMTMCPSGEHPTGWQHVPGPHKTCDICR